MNVARRFRGIVAVGLILLTTVSTAYAKYSGGSGTVQDPYQIATAADLIALGETPDDYDKHFVLTADIDLAPNLPGRKVFDKAVIGPAGSSFAGVFDGNSHTISHLTIKGKDYVGLFGQLSGEVKNVGVVDVNTTGSRDYVGGLVGNNYYGNVTDCYSTGVVSGTGSGVGGLVGYNKGAVTDCYSTGAAGGSGYNIGGLVGYNEGAVTGCYSTSTVTGRVHSVGGLVGFNEGYVTNCHSTGAVSGTGSWVGGLVGDNGGTVTRCFSTGVVSGTGSGVGGLVGENAGPVTQCCSTGAVNGHETVGGLVGFNGGDVTDCHSTGAVSGTGSWVGGLVGVNSGTVTGCFSTGVVSSTGSGVGGLVGFNWDGPVTQCYSTGAVNAHQSVGGLVGYNDNWVTRCYSTGVVSGTGPGVGGLIGDNGRTVTDCYSTGAVSGSSHNIGGLMGYNEGAVTDCYSTGTVTGGTHSVGGLVGFNPGIVIASFWDTQTSREATSAGGTGKTTAQMKTAKTFLDAGWDFVGETKNGTADIWWILEGKDYPHLWRERTVWFPDYMPISAAQHGIKTFEWTYGKSGQFTSQVGGPVTVHYGNGTTLTGVAITNFFDSEEGGSTGFVYNDGSSVKILGVEEHRELGGCWFFSSDANLTSHSPMLSYTGVYDGMMNDERGFYLVKQDRSASQQDFDHINVFDIQDVKVLEGRYDKAVIMWDLRTDMGFTPLDWAGKDAELGIVLPTAEDTGGYAVTGVWIFGRDRGFIAYADHDSGSGRLIRLAELKRVQQAP
ncbi:MAG: hypothetical protein NTZ17_04445 [Phycisphaerae bacterium]|nr:hypothetical protein [Phycisphaerae bacterium]